MNLSNWFASLRKTMSAPAVAEEELAQARSKLANTELELVELYEKTARSAEPPSNVIRLDSAKAVKG